MADQERRFPAPFELGGDPSVEAILEFEAAVLTDPDTYGTLADQAAQTCDPLLGLGEGRTLPADFGKMLTAHRDEDAIMDETDPAVKAKRLSEFWGEIGKGEGGFYDDIRENGCSSCGSHHPGCCDGCA